MLCEFVTFKTGRKKQIMLYFSLKFKEYKKELLTNDNYCAIVAA